MTGIFSNWQRQLRDRANVQLGIATDLGFEASDAKALLLKHDGPFQEAGDLIDKLNDVEASKGDPVNLQPLPVPTPDPQPNLLSDTLALYHNSKCFRCHVNPRTVVLLPCSELTLCVACAKVAKTCPYCDHNIEYTIKTFY